MTATLPLNEAAELRRHEETIERGKKASIEVGQALAAIQDGKLYRARWKTFEDYVAERWGMSRRHAYRLMDFAAAVGANPQPLAGLSEGAVRELAGTSVEFQRAVVDRAKTHTDKPTAKDIAEAKREQVAEELRAKTPTMPAEELKSMAAKERAKTARQRTAEEERERREKHEKHWKDWPAKCERDIEAGLVIGLDPADGEFGWRRLYNYLREKLGGKG